MSRFRTEREADGRWLAEDKEHPGVMAYGQTQAEAEVAVRELAERVAEKPAGTAQEKLIVTRDEKMKEKLRKYPGPFSVNNFVNKYEVHDANGSECRGIAGLIEWALNRAREEEPV